MKTRLWAGSILLILLSGCQEKQTEQSPPPKPQSPLQAPSQTVNATPGTSDAYGSLIAFEGRWPVVAREHLWKVKWKTLTAQGTQSAGVSQGQMRTVSGLIYKDEQPSLTFTADGGQGSQAPKVGHEKSTRKILSLRGNVIVSTVDKRSTLTCDSLDYDSAKELLIARGNVKLQGSVGSVGTFTELVATSDLTKVGMPDLFDHS